MNIKDASILIPDECDKPLAYYAIRCLKAANSNLKINVFAPSNKISDDNSWLIFYKHSRYIDRLIVSKNEIDSVDYLNEILKLIENENIDLVLPASEIGFKFVSKFREELSHFCRLVPLPNHDALHTAFNKWNLSIFLKEHNISAPTTVLLGELQQINQLTYPILVKPVDGSGGENIQKFDKPAAINFPTDRDTASKNYIVQEYIDGYDIDCNVLCHEGEILAYTVQQPLGVEAGFSPKIDKLKFVHDPAVFDLVKRTMHGLQWSGIAHLDLRYCSKTGQLYLIEINPRFWQSLMGSLSVGVNFPYLLYLLSIGADFEPVYYQEQYYAKFPRFIKDALSGSLNYSLDKTNLKYFLTDLIGVIQFNRHRLLGK